MKLEIELVPRPLWGKNPRSAMGQANWDIVRRATYAEYGNKCGICGASGRMEAHEIWEYNDIENIQTLTGLIALCWDCHKIKHFGMSRILADRGELNLNLLVDHFLKVNNVSLHEFHVHYQQAVAMHVHRSAQAWTQNWGPYQEYVT